MSSATTAATNPTPLYARFSRRLRGIVIDWIIAMVVLFGAVMLASAVRNDDVSRTLGCLVIAFLLLYEPVLVTLTGGTLGHTFSNLRVVDDVTGGNVSFSKALARLVIKAVLSWYSFVILAATRRNQAAHDLLTRSTVQIRDPAKARPGQYVTERAEPADGTMPSRLRRSVVTALYLALSLALYFMLVGGLIVAGALSERCVDQNFCSAGERFLSVASAIGALLLVAGVIALGWRGRLPGARRT
jgi:RDD family